MRSAITENDLRELKDLINLRFQQMDSKFVQIDSRFDCIETKIDNLVQDVNEIKIQLTKTQESITGLDIKS